MPDPEYDAETLRRVTAIAAHLQSRRPLVPTPAPDDHVTPEEMDRIGKEVGIDPTLMRQAFGAVLVERAARRHRQRQGILAVVAVCLFLGAGLIMGDKLRRNGASVEVRFWPDSDDASTGASARASSWARPGRPAGSSPAQGVDDPGQPIPRPQLLRLPPGASEPPTVDSATPAIGAPARRTGAQWSAAPTSTSALRPSSENLQDRQQLFALVNAEADYLTGGDLNALTTLYAQDYQYHSSDGRWLDLTGTMTAYQQQLRAAPGRWKRRISQFQMDRDWASIRVREQVDYRGGGDDWEDVLETWRRIDGRWLKSRTESLSARQ